jgi:hypothetical protein
MGGTGDPPVPVGDSPTATLFVPVLVLVLVLVVVLVLGSPFVSLLIFCESFRFGCFASISASAFFHFESSTLNWPAASPFFASAKATYAPLVPTRITLLFARDSTNNAAFNRPGKSGHRVQGEGSRRPTK